LKKENKKSEKNRVLGQPQGVGSRVDILKNMLYNIRTASGRRESGVGSRGSLTPTRSGQWLVLGGQ